MIPFTIQINIEDYSWIIQLILEVSIFIIGLLLIDRKNRNYWSNKYKAELDKIGNITEIKTQIESAAELLKQNQFSIDEERRKSIYLLNRISFELFYNLIDFDVHSFEFIRYNSRQYNALNYTTEAKNLYNSFAKSVGHFQLFNSSLSKEAIEYSQLLMKYQSHILDRNAKMIGMDDNTRFEFTNNTDQIRKEADLAYENFKDLLSTLI